MYMRVCFEAGSLTSLVMQPSTCGQGSKPVYVGISLMDIPHKTVCTLLLLQPCPRIAWIQWFSRRAKSHNHTRRHRVCYGLLQVRSLVRRRAVKIAFPRDDCTYSFRFDHIPAHRPRHFLANTTHLNWCDRS